VSERVTKLGSKTLVDEKGTSMLDFAVIGLGYVGLPLAREATRWGLGGVGVDASLEVVSSLGAGLSHVDDLSNEDIDEMLSRGFRVTSDATEIAKARTVVMCVPTPLRAEGGPDLGAVRAATENVRDNLRAGMLVILESTTWPGTTDEVVRPILEQSGLKAGVDFHLAYSPERIDPGNAVYGIWNTPKVVGGFTPSCGVSAADFYRRFVKTVVPAAGTREAEMSKLLENTYRQVNIALVNEMAKFSHELNIDIWDVIRCAKSKPFGFQAFLPGPGVGGHCIPIDPSYLAHLVQADLGYPFRFVELAQEVNRSMPRYVVHRAQRMLNSACKSVRGSQVLLLGVTYKAGIADQRESPVQPLASELLELGADVQFYDPFVEEWSVGGQTLQRAKDLSTALRTADLVIHLQAHSDYSADVLSKIERPILDTRGVLAGAHVTAL
jgi:nucleotide sugar dehydrogenase